MRFFDDLSVALTCRTCGETLKKLVHHFREDVEHHLPAPCRACRTDLRAEMAAMLHLIEAKERDVAEFFANLAVRVRDRGQGQA